MTLEKTLGIVRTHQPNQVRSIHAHRLDITTTLQDGVLKAVETSQRWTLGALRKTTEAMEGMIPETPKLPLFTACPRPPKPSTRASTSSSAS